MKQKTITGTATAIVAVVYLMCIIFVTIAGYKSNTWVREIEQQKQGAANAGVTWQQANRNWIKYGGYKGADIRFVKDGIRY